MIAFFARGKLTPIRDERTGYESSLTVLVAEDEDALLNLALPALLGLAVGAALQYGIGQASVALYLRAKAKEEAEAEDESAEEEGEESSG